MLELMFASKYKGEENNLNIAILLNNLDILFKNIRGMEPTKIINKSLELIKKIKKQYKIE